MLFSTVSAWSEFTMYLSFSFRALTYWTLWRLWNQEEAAAPRELEEWSPASLELILLAPMVVLGLWDRGWALGMEPQRLPHRQESDWDTVPLSAWEPRDLAHSTAENCPGKVGVGGIGVWWNPATLISLLWQWDQSAGVTWRLPPIPITNVKLK